MILCPNCNADMHFSPEKQMLVCGYCDATLSPEAYAEAEGLLTSESEYFETTIFSCPQCGGEVMNSEETAATFCSYCGASVMLTSRIGKEKKPKKIIPFLLGPDAVKERYKKGLRRALFAPKMLKTDSHIEKFRGIYMPYWSYSTSTDQKISTTGTIEEREGDYIITDTFKVKADCTAEYSGISYDASSTFSDDISEHISPYDTFKAVDFNPAYMSGFYADKGDVAADVYNKDVEDYAKSVIVSAMSKESEFEDLSLDAEEISKQIELTEPEAQSVLYPVWFLTNRYGKDRVTYAVVNGQTGKIAADIPIDPVKYIIASILFMIPVFLLLNLLPAIEPPTVILIAMVLHIIAIFISLYQDYRIGVIENHEEDSGYKSVNTTSENKSTKSAKVKDYYYHIAILIAGIILFFADFSSDYVYYACCAVVMFAIAFNFIRIIRQRNIITTHKPPQLNKRGGDENE